MTLHNILYGTALDSNLIKLIIIIKSNLYNNTSLIRTPPFCLHILLKNISESFTYKLCS